MTDVTEIKIGGFGGQGVILTGMIVGKAAAVAKQRQMPGVEIPHRRHQADPFTVAPTV